MTSIGSGMFYNCMNLTSVTLPNSVTSIGNEAFSYCHSLTNITIPASVVSFDFYAFLWCTSLKEVHFLGNAPSGTYVFWGDDAATAYYLSGTTGWGSYIGGMSPDNGGIPTALWIPASSPDIQLSGASFGGLSNQFGFNITGSGNQQVVVEACTDLANPVWLPIYTNTLTGGSIPFSDPDWTNYPGRFYRVQVMDNNLPANMALIPAGNFTMGDNLDGYSPGLPLHTVSVSAFYMDKYDVTEALWQQVFNWARNHGYSFDYPGSVPGSAYSSYSKGPNYPVVILDWYDCVKWCNARSEMEGRTPAYYTSAAQTTVYRTGEVDVDNDSVKWNAGYRLPTEAEWEKAARGGASGQRFPWGNTISWSQANYYAYPLSADPDYGYAYDVNPTEGYHPTFSTGDYPYTNPVGYFAANGYGLYDMAGNVWQWCWDWYGDYSSGSQTDPRGPTTVSARVQRGGSWTDTAGYGLRSADRGAYTPVSANYNIGFRSVLSPGQ
jgi:formylglycine-generating enzyme required for sulfatase activity